jgi:enoyl-CoA hydratase/carnithine racemase
VIAANAPLAVEATKELLHKGHPESDLWKSAGWKASEDVRTNLFSTNDAKEGALAFVEKRKPIWKRN